jgi:hypothetical protein
MAENWNKIKEEAKEDLFVKHGLNPHPDDIGKILDIIKEVMSADVYVIYHCDAAGDGIIGNQVYRSREKAKKDLLEIVEEINSAYENTHRYEKLSFESEDDEYLTYSNSQESLEILTFKTVI